MVRSLLRALELGSSSKAVLDAVIDACSAMQVRCAGHAVHAVCIGH